MFFFFFSVFCVKTTDSLISANAKELLLYKCNCIMISNTFNFFKT